MKLAIYSHFFAPSVGGVETAVLSLATGLRELRAANGDPEFEVILVTHTPAGDFDDRALPFRVVRQPSLLQLWRILRQSDVIHIAGPALLPLFLGALLRKPVVVEHHGYQAICPNGVLVHQPDGSVCPGHFQAGQYQECLRCRACETSVLRSLPDLLLMFPRFWLSRTFPANLAISRHVLERHHLPRSAVVYYGIDDPLSQNSFPCAPANPTNSVCFAYVGRFFPEKGIPILLQAAGILSQEDRAFEVRLIGDGPERPKLEEIIKTTQLDSCVHITGFLTGAALAKALADVHVVVMPSVWEETAGLAAIEQMMRGRLVIASRAGGLAEIVGDAGFQFPLGDARALADCMRRVVQDPSIINSTGTQARGRALQLFSRSRMIQDHANVYRQVMNRRDS